MKTLLTRITAQHSTARSGGRVTFRDDRGEVCTSACRAAAHRDRVATAAHRARL
ncbi:hypothetical protein [Actinomadura chokoriensis]|uniref:Uncharacterized protein n=1 Tax=Actinomadura chokoriensis TaxID=454156 RepID=A0ABV4R1Z0_9ACTN|nr:hypothetical protein [Actinomadura lepetitiana]